MDNTQVYSIEIDRDEYDIWDKTLSNIFEKICSTYAKELIRPSTYVLQEENGKLFAHIFISDDKPLLLKNTTKVLDIEAQIQARILRKTPKK